MTVIRLDRIGPVACLALDRPPHNFFDVAMLEEIAAILERCESDPEVRVSLLVSKHKNFCAGADFGEGRRPDPGPIYTSAVKLLKRTKPLVAAIGGAAVGGGLGLALIADLRIGDDTSWFQANFTRIGISAGFGISFTMPRVVGPQRTRDLLLTARRVPSREALAIGLLDRVVEAGTLQDAALALATEIAANSPAATSATLRLLGRDDADHFAAAVVRELGLQRPLFAAPDFDEGVRASAERRTPQFSNLQEHEA